MVFKRVLLLAVSAFISASIAVAGGPDIVYKPSPPKPKRIAEEKLIEPLAKEKKEMIHEVGRAEIIPAQPSSPMPAAREIETIVRKEAVAAKVTVLFESNPQNSELMVNGLYVGSTPIQIPLYDGVHNVKVVAPGYTLWERQIKAYQGLRVYAILEKGKVVAAAGDGVKAE